MKHCCSLLYNNYNTNETDWSKAEACASILGTHLYSTNFIFPLVDLNGSKVVKAFEEDEEDIRDDKDKPALATNIIQISLQFHKSITKF